MNWKKEEIAEFSILTEKKGPLNNLEFFIVEYKNGKIERDNPNNKWYKKQEDGVQDTNLVKPIRFIYINSLENIEDIIKYFRLYYQLNGSIQISQDKNFLHLELRRELISLLKIKPTDIDLLFQETESAELTQLTHYFSRLNRAGVLLDVVDLLIAKIYGERNEPFPLRNILQNTFSDDTLRNFFNLKDDDDPSTKFKLLLQVVSLYFYNKLSDDAILKITQQNLLDFEFEKFSMTSIPINKKVLIRESWRKTIEFLREKLAINSISKLRYDRLFVILMALNYHVYKEEILNKSYRDLFENEFDEILKVWILRESISFNLATGSNKPPERYKTFINKSIPSIIRCIENEEEISRKEILDEIFVPTLSDENLSDKEFGKALMSILLKENGIYDFYDKTLSKKITTCSQVIEDTIELHHIFPKNMVNDANLKRVFDIGLNLTPLKKKTNSDKLGNKHPFKYIQEMMGRFKMKLYSTK